MKTILDLIVAFIPWRPIAWDIPLTRPATRNPIHQAVWSEAAKRWVWA